ncbi:hypothetical protein Tco_0190827 [Tanacetum coccineum]
MEGLTSNDELSNDGWRRWESHEITYHDHDEIKYENETHRQELYNKDALQAYQEISLHDGRRMDDKLELNCLYIQTPWIWRISLLDVIRSLFFSTVDTTYSLNEYNVFDTGTRESNIGEYWWRIYKYGDLEVLES